MQSKFASTVSFNETIPMSHSPEHQPKSDPKAYENVSAILDTKLQAIQDREMSLAAKLEQAKTFALQLDQREREIQQQELSMADKQEQLFRAYDTLTEKIFQYERDSDDLKLRRQ